MNEVRIQNGRFAWAGGEYPAGDFSMCNMDKNKYKLIRQETNKIITEMDESQAFWELHEGAVYMYDIVNTSLHFFFTKPFKLPVVVTHSTVFA